MGKTSERFMDGWRAFERGEALFLGLETDLDFARGWLEAAELALSR